MIKLLAIGLFLTVSTPLWLLTLDFYEQVACSKYQVMCKAKMINWNKGKHDERATYEDAAQSLRFFGRSEAN